jgi:hypothetical protein
MPCSPSKRSTRMARGMDPTMSGHHPPAKYQKPPVRLCPPLAGRFSRTNLRLTPFRASTPHNQVDHIRCGNTARRDL